MHASFPHCYPHGIKYLAVREWICSFAGSSEQPCIRDILSICDTSHILAPFCDNDQYFFFYLYWITESGEWVDKQSLPEVCTTNKKQIPQKEKKEKAPLWRWDDWWVFWVSSPLSKYPLVCSWKPPHGFEEWLFHCLYWGRPGHSALCQLTNLTCQTG